MDGMKARLMEHLRQVRAWAGKNPEWALALVAAGLYLINLGGTDLSSGEARNVLGVGSSRLSLVRWLAAGSQMFFWRNEFWARFPFVLFGALGVALIYLLVEELSRNRRWAFFAALALMLFAPWIICSRLVSPAAPLVTGGLLAGIGYARIRKHTARRRDHWLLGLGLALVLMVLPSVWANGLSTQTLADRTWFHRNRAEVVKAINHDGTAVVLGAHGYDAQYYFPVPVQPLPLQDDLRLVGPIFVFRPKTLDSKEQALLRDLHFDRLIGNVAVYRAR